ncbi:MAG: DUF2905 domain-containing protein [Candidatus Kaelpia imicola]|nr:DUF2905 domain-containing protein [Candidatus Kaelpia imicola]
MAKILIITGLLMVVVGGFILVFGKIPYFGKLPGDIVIKRGSLTFYLPFTTLIILSIALSIIMRFLIRK